MTPQTFIFFGPSGCGKGTQAKLLIEYLEKIDSSKKIFYLEIGNKLRKFVTNDSFTAKLTKEVMDSGGLMPEFMPIWVWSQFMIDSVSGNEHIIFDGICRRVAEAPILDSAIKFYKRESPIIVSIELGREEARKRLLGRGRGDDNEQDIRNRLDWYDRNVLLAINYFKNNPYYKFLSINGEQSIEEVHAEILNKTNL